MAQTQDRNSRTPERSGLDKKLARYALAGGAVLAAPLTSHADIMYSGLVNETVSLGTTPLNVDFGVNPGFTLAVSFYNPGAVGYNQGASVSGAMGFVDDSSGVPEALAFGSLISTANATGPGGELLNYGSFAPSAFTGFKGGNWPQDHSNAYLGLEYTVSGQTYTAWAQINVDVDGTFGNPTATLVDYAYETTPGVSITAGETTSPVPEPSSLALLALGGPAALALLRRRRAARAQ